MIKPIDSRASKLLKDNPMMCLRSARTGIVISVSYSIKGLKWLSDKNGRSIFYENGVIRNGRVESTDGGPLRQSTAVVVTRFFPKNHESGVLQAAEYAAVNKAFKMLYRI